MITQEAIMDITRTAIYTMIITSAGVMFTMQLRTLQLRTFTHISVVL